MRNKVPKKISGSLEVQTQARMSVEVLELHSPVFYNAPQQLQVYSFAVQVFLPECLHTTGSSHCYYSSVTFSDI